MLALDRIKALLDQRGIRSVLGPVSSSLARHHKKGVKRIFYDDGIWMHETETGYFAYPQPFLRLDLKHLDESARETFFWKYWPRPGDVVMDIGAGVGEETLSFSRAVGPLGKVICVEAHPRTYHCLEKLVQYNALTNVICVHRAIADIPDATAMIMDSGTYVGNRLSSVKGKPVQATTVDALHRELSLGRIHFLKMNIEGAERLAIRGMSEILKQTEVLCISCHDFLAMRNGDDSVRTKNEVRHFLEGRGIKICERAAGMPCIRDQVWGLNEQLLRDFGPRHGEYGNPE
ncbi:MAG: FkbM family methyltransferase [Candidatus Sulfotelmatobacter sp.]|jgi:FkbM family methyltransferase